MLRDAIRPTAERPPVRRAALTALVLALLMGAAAAFALTEALKLERSPLVVRRVDRVVAPLCACPERRASIVVRLRDGDTIDASIVDGDGEVVRILVRGLERPRGLVRLRWNGRDDGGRVVPDGSYRLRIRLRAKERTIVIPRTIRVDAAA